MTNVQIYLIVAPFVLLLLAVAAVWVAGLLDDAHSRRDKPPSR